MEFGTKLKELEMTTEEVERLSKALKDEKFREMLHEYAEEISNPENKRKYEEEIAQLEQERGMEVKFIHPKPHHVLKTSVDGKEKCFINICSNTLINKPTCVPRRAENGQVGQQWSLPYSLTPGRPDRDNKGKKCTIYDVVFHPDTLHIAGKDPRFMKLVNDTAVQGVEDAFNVKLDKANTKFLKMQYKGVPHAAVIRKPIPGHCGNSPEDTFPIPYPETVHNENPSLPTVPMQADPSTTKDSSLPTQPNYTIKYRSMVDLQDYRSTRDSAPSPRPKEIIITIDLPLLKSAADVDLDVTEKTLTLESRKPAYKLELELSYPVDDDRGDAKFNKAKKQLTITLPVKPSKEPFPCSPWGNLLDNETESADKADEIVYKEELVKEQVQLFGDMPVHGEPESQISSVEVKNRAMDFELNPEPSSLIRTDAPDELKISAYSCEAQPLVDRMVQAAKGLQFCSSEVKSKTDTEADSDKQNEQKISVISCDGQALDDGPAHEESELKFSRKEVDCCKTDFASNPDVLMSAETDKTLTCERTNDDTPGPKSKTMNGPEIGADVCCVSCEHQTKTETENCTTEDCILKDEEVHGSDVESTEQSDVAPVISKNGTQHHPTHETENLAQPEISVAEQRGQEVVPPGDDANEPSGLSCCEVELTAVNSGPIEADSTLQTRPVETEALAENEHVHYTPGHKDIKSAARQEQVDKIQSSEQSINMPVILREKTSDGSEVVISDHTTTAALSFQNSLWFELD
ncbi:protein kintoun [Trichomycterus rosablanca]|uniref:protein kintoun n=1 Tax=Trichomycterus rosablanca TaxID=2290929 RepID=UPI002F360D6E